MLHQQELDQLSDDLSNSLVNLYEFKVLFENNKEQLDLLNNTAPFFFLKLYDFYWNELIMSISRLTDRSVQRKHKNLSIYILEDFSTDLPPDKRYKLRTNLEGITKEVQLVRQYRHKFISHRDIDAIKVLPENRETLYVQKVEEIFSLIEDSINIFYRLNENTYVDHKPALVVYGAQTLLYYLQLGKTIDAVGEKVAMQKEKLNKNIIT